jgi:hypothetical protein
VIAGLDKPAASYSERMMGLLKSEEPASFPARWAPPLDPRRRIRFREPVHGPVSSRSPAIPFGTTCSQMAQAPPIFCGPKTRREFNRYNTRVVQSNSKRQL